MMDETLRSAYDYDFLFRYLESGNIIGFIDEPLAVWRTHEGQESKDIRRAKRLQAKILYHFLLRHPDFIAKHPLMVLKKYRLRQGVFCSTNQGFRNNCAAWRDWWILRRARLFLSYDKNDGLCEAG